MRLLHSTGNGNFSLATFHGDEIPPYAILSHTWGQDEDEVSYEDIRNGNNFLSKPGFRKLSFCYGRVLQDGLQYCWVDTCCINKQSDPELSEAINSMFRWYKRAARCYVYLSDHTTSQGWEHFSQSRWFTRGWTLQELLAPRQVDFYDADGLHLGNKTTLAPWINYTTRIPPSALSGQPLDTFSVQDRLSWAKYRHTKREEDGAYSLLGIFGVMMSLIYGEGRDSAYGRLLHKVESSGQRRINTKYTAFLPSGDPPSLKKALTTDLNHDPAASSSPSAAEHLEKGKARKHHAQRISSPSASSDHGADEDKEMKPIYDAERQVWVQQRWSSEYTTFYRMQYVEGM